LGTRGIHLDSSSHQSLTSSSTSSYVVSFSIHPSNEYDVVFI
jgi:hypothetical protein